MIVIKQIVMLFFGQPHCHNQTQHSAQITSLYERLAVSQIKEESVHVGEEKCHHSTAGEIKGAAMGSRQGVGGFDAHT